MTVATIDPAVLAQQLAKRQPLDSTLDESARRAACAEALRRAGAAFAPQSRSARTVLSALKTLEDLAGLGDGSLQRIWLALRALDLKPGEHVGGALVADAVVEILLRAGGAVPTLDLDDRVGGIIGGLDGRAPETLTARARVVEAGLSGTGFEIRNGDAPIFAEGARAATADQLLKAIDQLETRHASGLARPTAQAFTGALPRTPQPVAYEVIQAASSDALAGDVLFETYRPARMRIANAQAHPSPLVESAALASVLPPEPVYQPWILPEVVTQGRLSDVQLEIITYAGQAHQAYLPSDPMDPNGTPPRQGYLVGAGTGVGKGSINAGIVADNWAQGRKRAVWLSERHRHIKDLYRDWVAVGGKTADVIDLRDIKPGDQIPGRNGILFATYSLLRGEYEGGSRVEQIIEWLGLTSDAVVVMDECQNLRNALVRDAGFRGGKASKQGEAALKLQGALPNARVVYSSATSASDIASMGYAVRLGLWGRGTAFPTAQAFFEQMETGGLNALELVARDLKALGLYTAPNLSFDGVQYERLEHRLTDEERAIQDSLADAWARVNIALQGALASTGVATLGKNAGRAVCALALAQFGMARSRFFQAFQASLKTKVVIEAVRRDLAAGNAAVIQLTNTYEANADRALAEAKTGDLSEIEATPKDILVEYVRNQFPVQKYQVVRAGKNFFAQPLFDAQGNPVTCPKAEAERDKLIQDLQAISMPEGPLEQLLAAFGPEAIAEVTGRRRRLVPGDAPGTRKIEERTASSVDEDIRAFQSGAKMALVFSTSGAAGSSYHADRNCGNTALRRHYLVQPGWRADLAIQGLGRSHRSNQVQPPCYILVTTDLWADRRMISTVASGMQRLGAITRGQRQAASQELFTEDDNLESQLAADAWLRFLKDLEARRVPNLSLATFERDTGIPIRKPGTQDLVNDVPEVRRFLNAMSGMPCDQQEAFGAAYKQRLDEVRLEAIRNGSFDRGIETLKPESLIKLEESVIHRDPRTGAATRLLKMLRRDPVEAVSYQDAVRHAIRSGNARFVKSALTNRVACLVFPRLGSGQHADPEDKVLQITPTGMKQRPRKEIVKERWVLTVGNEAEDLWVAESAMPPEDDETLFYVVAGTLLPLWDKLPKRRAIVYRMETDEGERILGRVLPEEWADRFTTRVNAMNGAAIDPAQALAEIEKGNIATLANGWVVEGRRTVSGVSWVEVVVTDTDSHQYRTELEADGLVVSIEPLTKKYRFLLPTDARERDLAWAKVTQYRPIVGLTSF